MPPLPKRFLITASLLDLLAPQQVKTRFGPNRVAADMERNGEFYILLIYEDFLWNYCWRWEIFQRNWFVVRGRSTPINRRTTKKMSFWGHCELWPPNSLWGKIWPKFSLSIWVVFLPWCSSVADEVSPVRWGGYSWLFWGLGGVEVSKKL